LTNNQVLHFPGAGHDVIQWNNCAVPVMLSFLDDPIGDYDTSCVEQLTVPPFATPA
jgi:hypothetical protein